MSDDHFSDFLKKKKFDNKKIQQIGAKWEYPLSIIHMLE